MHFMYYVFILCWSIVPCSALPLRLCVLFLFPCLGAAQCSFEEFFHGMLIKDGKAPLPLPLPFDFHFSPISSILKYYMIAY